MAKHDFESDTMTTHDIMHCTRVFRVGFDRVRVTSSRVGSFGFQDYWSSKARPTGAHRFHPYSMCPESYIPGYMCPMLSVDSVMARTRSGVYA